MSEQGTTKLIFILHEDDDWNTDGTFEIETIEKMLRVLARRGWNDVLLEGDA